MGGSINNKWVRYMMLAMATIGAAVITAIINYPIRYYFKEYINYEEKIS